MKAAQQEMAVGNANTQEQRAVTLLEAAITYIQLDTAGLADAAVEPATGRSESAAARWSAIECRLELTARWT